MKAAIGAVVIFSLAIRAHHEIAHGGSGTVVGDVLDDGESGAAVGAVGEGIAIAPILLVKDLLLTFMAGGNVGGDKLIFPGYNFTLADLEALKPWRCNLLYR